MRPVGGRVEKPQRAGDHRMLWLEAKVMSHMRCKLDDVHRAVETDDDGPRSVQRFLDHPGTRALTVSLAGTRLVFNATEAAGGAFHPATAQMRMSDAGLPHAATPPAPLPESNLPPAPLPQSSVKRKVIVISKVRSEAVTPQNLTSLLTVTELSEDPAAMMRQLCNYVYYPLLAAEENAASAPTATATSAATCPSAVRGAVRSAVRNIAGASLVFHGNMEGITALPETAPLKTTPVTGPQPTVPQPPAGPRGGAMRGRTFRSPMETGLSPRPPERNGNGPSEDAGSLRATVQQDGEKPLEMPVGTTADGTVPMWLAQLRRVLRDEEPSRWLWPQADPNGAAPALSPAGSDHAVSDDGEDDGEEAEEDAEAAPAAHPDREQPMPQPSMSAQARVAVGSEMLPVGSPLAEFHFRTRRLKDLQFVKAQTERGGFTDTLAALDARNNPYAQELHAAVASLDAEIATERKRCRWLEPMVPLLEALNQEGTARLPFDELVQRRTITSLFVMMRIMWDRFPEYATVPRVTAYMRGIFDDVVASAVSYLSLDLLFVADPHEVTARMTTIVSVAGNLKDAFHKFAHGPSPGVKEGQTPPPSRHWPVAPTALFSRLDSFLERCHDVADVIEDRRLHQSLHTVDLSDDVGLRQAIGNAGQDFDRAVKTFAASLPLIGKPESPAFPAALERLRVDVKTIDRTVANAVTGYVEPQPLTVRIVRLLDALSMYFQKVDLAVSWTEILNLLWRRWRDELRHIQTTLRAIPVAPPEVVPPEALEATPPEPSDEKSGTVSPAFGDDSDSDSTASSAPEATATAPRKARAPTQGYFYSNEAQTVIEAAALLRSLTDLDAEISSLGFNVATETETYVEARSANIAVGRKAYSVLRRSLNTWDAHVRVVTTQQRAAALLSVTEEDATTGFTAGEPWVPIESRQVFSVTLSPELHAVGRDAQLLSRLLSGASEAFRVLNQRPLQLTDYAETFLDSYSEWHSSSVALATAIESSNEIRRKVRAAEVALVADEADAIVSLVMEGVTTRKWADGTAAEFAEAIEAKTQRLEAAMAALGAGAEELHGMFQELSKQGAPYQPLPLHYADVGDKTFTVPELTAAVEENIAAKITKLKEVDEKLDALSRRTNIALNDVKDEGGLSTVPITSPAWLRYVTHIEAEVTGLFSAFAQASVENIQHQVDAEWMKQRASQVAPLMEGSAVLLPTKQAVRQQRAARDCRPMLAELGREGTAEAQRARQRHKAGPAFESGSDDGDERAAHEQALMGGGKPVRLRVGPADVPHREATHGLPLPPLTHQILAQLDPPMALLLTPSLEVDVIPLLVRLCRAHHEELPRVIRRVVPADAAGGLNFAAHDAGAFSGMHDASLSGTMAFGNASHEGSMSKDLTPETSTARRPSTIARETFEGAVAGDAELARLRRMVRDSIEQTLRECGAFLKRLTTVFGDLWRHGGPVAVAELQLVPPAKAPQAATAPTPALLAGQDLFVTLLPTTELAVKVFGSTVEHIGAARAHFVALADRVIAEIQPTVSFASWFRIDTRQLRQTLHGRAHKVAALLTHHVVRATESRLQDIESFTVEIDAALEASELLWDDAESAAVRAVFLVLRKVDDEHDEITRTFPLLAGALEYVEKHCLVGNERLAYVELLGRLEKLEPSWHHHVKRCLLARERLHSLREREASSLRVQVKNLQRELRRVQEELQRSVVVHASFTALLRACTERGKARDNVTDASAADVELGGSGLTAYGHLAASQKEFATLQQRCVEIKEDLLLYDVQDSETVDPSEANRWLREAKVLWDIAFSAASQLASWSLTPLWLLRSPSLQPEVRLLRDALSQRPGFVKKWPLHRSIDAKLKQFGSALPLVHDLTQGTLRRRHWQAVAAACRAPAFPDEHDPHSPTFTLGQLLDLGVHAHVAPVARVLEQAEKERQVERGLNAVAATWAALTVPAAFPGQGKAEVSDLESEEDAMEQKPEAPAKETGRGVKFVVPAIEEPKAAEKKRRPLKDTRTPAMIAADDMQCAMLQAPEPVNEQLEAHLASLQAMQNSRWVGVFRTVAAAWHRRLTIVDATLTAWLDVQREWVSLRPIFLGNDDIRTELPDHVVAFDEADATLQSIMRRVTPSQRLVSVCTTAALLSDLSMSVSVDRLDMPSADDMLNSAVGPAMSMQMPPAATTAADSEERALLRELERLGGVLSSTAKDLSQYLLSKRMLFPRFFFMADADLVDLLSANNDPVEIAGHISKIIDAAGRCVLQTKDQIIASVRRLSISRNADDEDRPATAWTAEQGPFSWVDEEEVAPLSTAESGVDGALVDVPSQRRATRHPHPSLRNEETVYITALVSRDGCVLRLLEPCPCLGAVEVWLHRLLNAMRAAVRRETSDACATQSEAAASLPPKEWVFARISQATCTASRVQWTSETTAALEALEEGRESALVDLGKSLKQRLSQLIDVVVEDLTPEKRQALITLVTIEVHQRDIVADLGRRGVDSVQAFRWQSQLRAYGGTPDTEREASQQEPKGARTSRLQSFATFAEGLPMPEAPKDPVVSLRILDAAFAHDGEFFGNAGCLVVTPLTDRCYITLTQAVKLGMGGAPAGPAGTGKTETVKDIAKALGVAVYVFNCSDQMGIQSLGSIFKGLAMSGAWGCFDEFNRIAIEVLSVVASQVRALFEAVRRGADAVTIVGDRVPLTTTTVGVFITMNPGYKGRTELPENIKSLFRPCAMVVPDVQSICEIMLAAEGFRLAAELAGKLVRLYELCADLLSRRGHYDWGLRAFRAILTVAGGLKRSFRETDERALLASALREINLARLTTADSGVFMKLLASLFPAAALNASFVGAHRRSLARSIVESAGALQVVLGDHDRVVDKALRLHDIIMVRHSVCVMGPALSGKTALLKLLGAALEHMSGRKTVMATIEPKALSADELYGSVNPLTQEWQDGVLSRAFRAFAAAPAGPTDASPTSPQRTPKDGTPIAAQSQAAAPLVPHTPSRWIVLDGAVDPSWVESMNSVMDDNKLLTLASNERITMGPDMRLICETADLNHATPATVSRFGILALDGEESTWAVLKDAWVLQACAPRDRALFDVLFEQYVPTFLRFVATAPGVLALPHRPATFVQSLCTLFAGILATPVLNEVREPLSAAAVEPAFLWCCVWAFGGAITSAPPFGGAPGAPDPRMQFSQFVRREAPLLRMPEEGTVFDYFPRFVIASPPSNGGSDGQQHRDSDGGVAISVSDSTGAVSAPNGMGADAATHLSLVWVAWETTVKEFTFDAAVTVTRQIVPTADTMCASFLLERLMPRSHGRHVMLVGPTGCGKTRTAEFFLSNRPFLSEGVRFADEDAEESEEDTYEDFASTHVGAFDTTMLVSSPRNSNVQRAFRTRRRTILRDDAASAALLSSRVHCSAATTARSIQAAVELPLEKRSNRCLGPRDSQRMAVVVDDLNIPTPDAFGSVGAVALLRQQIDHGMWFERARLARRDIADIRYLATMNPRADAAAVDPRFLAKFFTLAVGFGSLETMQKLFSVLASSYLLTVGARQEISSLAVRLVASTLDVWVFAARTFPPTAEHFHYAFSLHDVMRVMGSIVKVAPTTPMREVGGMWVLEASRAFGDRLATPEHQQQLQHFCRTMAYAAFTDPDGVAGQPQSDDELPHVPLILPAALERGPQAAPQNTAVTFAQGAVMHGFVSSPFGDGNDGEGGRSSAFGRNSFGKAGSDIGSTSTPSDRRLSQALVSSMGAFDDDEFANEQLTAARQHLHAYCVLKTTEYDTYQDLVAAVRHEIVDVSLAASIPQYDQAIDNLVRIARVLALPGGHVTLVGVGGSGRRSLTALAASLLQLDLVKASGGGAAAGGVRNAAGEVMSEAVQALLDAFRRAGLSNNRVCVFASDTDVGNDDAFLSAVHEVIAWDRCPAGLFSADEQDEIVSRLSSTAAQSAASAAAAASGSHGAGRRSIDGSASLRDDGNRQGAGAAASAGWALFQQRVGVNLRVALAVSPVAAVLKPLVRKFPRFASQVQMVFFPPWSTDALVSVAEKFFLSHPHVMTVLRGHICRLGVRPPPVDGDPLLLLLALRRQDKAAEADAEKAKKQKKKAKKKKAPVDSATEDQEGDGAADHSNTNDTPGGDGDGPATAESDEEEEETEEVEDEATQLEKLLDDTDDGENPGDRLWATDDRDYQVEALVGQWVLSLAECCAAVHRSADTMSRDAAGDEDKRVFLTPRSYMSLLALVAGLMQERFTEKHSQRTRLAGGLSKLKSTAQEITRLRAELVVKQEDTADMTDRANMLLERLSGEKEIAETQNKVAATEQARIQNLVEEVDRLVEECEADLAAAQPMVDAALAALNTLNKSNLTELKAFTKPPKDVQAVCACVLCLLTPATGRVPRDRSWNASRRMMSDVTRWMKELLNYDVHDIPQKNIDAVLPTVEDPSFNPQAVGTKSFAAGGLCSWVVHVVRFHGVRQIVRPKEQRMAEACHRLAQGKVQQERIDKRVREVNALLGKALGQHESAVGDMDACKATMEETAAKLDRARRLVASLGGERGRWRDSIKVMDNEFEFIAGSVILGAGAVAYAGPLEPTARKALLEQWTSAALQHGFPVRDPQAAATEVLIAGNQAQEWAALGLPRDDASLESAAIVNRTRRHCVLIDPQAQGAPWLRAALGVGATTPGSTAPSSPYATPRHTSPSLAALGSRSSASRVRTLALGSPTFNRDIAWAAEKGDVVLVEEAHTIPGLLLALLGHSPAAPAGGAADSSTAANQTQHVPLDSTLDHGGAVSVGDESAESASSRRGSGLGPIGPQGLQATSFEVKDAPAPPHEAHFSTARAVQYGEFEVHVADTFRLFVVVQNAAVLTPEIFASASVVNFSVTEMALAEQLLARAVATDKAELEESLQELETKLDNAKVTVRRCEDTLLQELAAAGDDVLSSPVLVDTLEAAKAEATALSETVKECQTAQAALLTARAQYRPIASRAAALYISMAELGQLEAVYRYSMPAFLHEFDTALAEVRADAAAEAEAEQQRQQRKTQSDAVALTLTEGLEDKAVELANTAHAVHARAVARVADAAALTVRVESFVQRLTDRIFTYVGRGLFSQHRVTFACIVAFAVLLRRGAISPKELAFLLRGQRSHTMPMPDGLRSWLGAESWQMLVALAELSHSKPKKAHDQFVGHDDEDVLDDDEDKGEMFRGLLASLQTTPGRLKYWVQSETPEAEPLPSEWRDATAFHRLLLLRCVRPDRLPVALRTFVVSVLGPACVADHGAPLLQLLDTTPASSPIMFILFPGADPGKAIDTAARNSGVSEADGGLRHVSLGQGQEAAAESALEHAREEGSWLVLHNVHLMRVWSARLEAVVAGMQPATRPKAAGTPQRDGSVRSSRRGSGTGLALSSDSKHSDLAPPVLASKGQRGRTRTCAAGFRLFLTAEPADTLPPLLVQLSTKVADEPPAGVKANFLRGYSLYHAEPWDRSAKPQQMHSLVFAMCFFHAVAVGRALYGPLGWSKKYPFGLGDLTACTDVLGTYLEDRPRVPWEDLRYIFGDIMYGGHVSDALDRRLCTTYLETLVAPEAIEEGELPGGMPLPTRRSHAETLRSIEEEFPAESPALFQLGPNSARQRDSAAASVMLKCLLGTFETTVTAAYSQGLDERKADEPTMTGGQRRRGSDQGPAAAEATDPQALRAAAQVEAIATLLGWAPEGVPTEDLVSRLDDSATPLQHVFLRECELFNALALVIRQSLESADAAVKGMTPMSNGVRELLRDVQFDRVPAAWMAAWGHTARPLAAFMSLTTEAREQLSNYALDAVVPKAVGLNLLLRPSALLAAVLHEAAARTGNDLDALDLVVDVTKKRSVQAVDMAAREGVFIFGTWLEGAVWDSANNTLADCPSRAAPFFQMPVLAVRAAVVRKINRQDTYAAPLYRTPIRGVTHVATLHLKTKQAPSFWVLRGTALTLDSYA